MALLLYYHSIGNTPLSVPLQVFRDHLNQISKAQLLGVSVSQMLLASPEKRKELVAISFDDCFLDVYENAVPLLLEYSFSATFYAVPGYDGITRWGNQVTGRWSDSRSAEFNIPFRYMGSTERKHLNLLGMEIGCHTLTHPNLDALSYEDQYNEILRAKIFLENEIKATITSFCYPRGRFNTDTIRAVSEIGFTSACTTRRDYFIDHTNIYEIPRYGVGADSEIFASVLAGSGGRISMVRRIWRKARSSFGKYPNYE